ncbi:SPARC/Testican, calcium-binding domain [Cinara cedri]|uniref:SPARC/Testican, calcium-binding domain n=1 Tax=Cinara cedri TaxID=506608 RepID=A0A5E4N282_9HEMI|nr:SPARC/Testican, calcium-binding domain [Cinara cedri]
MDFYEYGYHEVITNADNVAIVATAHDMIEISQMLTTAAQRTKDWLTNIELELAFNKFEVMNITKSRTHNECEVEIDNTKIPASPSLKYLDLHIDLKLNFSEHAHIVAQKTSITANKLMKIMSNISATRPRRSRLRAEIIRSQILYGVEF